MWHRLKKMNFGIGLIAFILCVVSFSSIVIPVRADNVWTDPKDDIRCYTQEQWESFEDAYDDPESVEEIQEILTEIWSQGTLSATPDSIDMTAIKIEDVGDNYKLTIYVEGDLTDDSPIYIYIWGNCSGGGFRIVGRITTGSGGSDGVFQHVDSSNTTLGTINIDHGVMDMTFPKTDATDCELYILIVYNRCADIFPNSFVEGSSSSTDTSTETSIDGACPTCYDEDVFLAIYANIISIVIVIAIILLIVYVISKARYKSN